MSEALSAEDRFRLLFVCTGNTCRSPMAEHIARRFVEDRGWQSVEVRSAGVRAFDGAPASRGALTVAAQEGLDLSGHRSAALTLEVAEWPNLILVMSHNHLMRVIDLGAGDRVAMLTSFAASEGGDSVPDSVSDPIGGSDEEYRETFRLLEALIERALRRLEPVLSS